MQPGQAVSGNRYKCCCGACHATTGAMVFAILQLLGGLGSIGQNWMLKVGSSNSSQRYNLGLLSHGIGASILALLVIIGLMRRKACLLLFQLVWCVITLICFVIGAIFVLVLIFVYADNQSGRGDDDGKLTAIILAVILLIVGAIHVWEFRVYLAAYRTLKEFSPGGDSYVSVPLQPMPQSYPAAGAPPGYMPQGYPAQQYPPGQYPAQHPGYPPQPGPGYPQLPQQDYPQKA